MTDSFQPNPSYQPHPSAPPPGWATPPSPPGKPAPGGSFNTLAIVSLVFSFFVSVVAVILGHIALVQIKRTGERGRPAALAGMIIGYAGVAFWSITIVTLLVVQALGGLSAFRPGAVGPFATPHPFSTQPDTGGGDVDGDGSGDLTFDAGQYLSRSDRVQISDGMLGDRDWASTGPKTDGTWSYASKDGTCTATFHEGDLSGTVHQNPENDLTTTDSYLAVITETTQAHATDHVSDDYFYYDQPDDDVRVEARSLGRFDGDGKPHITIARAFAMPGVGVDLDVSCGTKSATTDAYNHVLSVTGIVIGT